MKVSRELLTVAKIVPKLRLGLKKAGGGVNPTGPHKVKMLEDKIIRGIDPTTNKEIEYVEYILEENGSKKVYKTKLKDKDGKLSYLVQRLAEVNEGEEVILEMKKQGIKNYIEVLPVGNASSVEVEDEHDEEDELPAIV